MEQFLAERGQGLMRTAVLLTGSVDAGEDLLQTALERLLRKWHRLDGDPEGYLRRTLYNLATDGLRRQGRWRRKLPMLQTEARAPADPTAGVDLRDALVRLLLQLPPQQRVVLVLRYWEQLIPRLIADCVTTLPLGDAAAGFAVAGALAAACCAVFTFRACAGHVRRPALRAVLAAGVVLLPTALIEVANSGIDVPWYLMFAVFWALLWRPRSGAGITVAALIGMAAMSSQILTALYAPLAAARVIALPRAREQAVTFGLLAGGALQVPS